MIKKLLKWTESDFFTPLVLLIITILSYGIFSHSISFFMDDWYAIWFGHTFGASQYPAFFASDRPLEGYYYLLVSTLLGQSVSPFVWQIYGLVLRWLCAYSLLGMLNAIWPANRRQNTWVALLAAVFPGFTQQWIVVSFSFHLFCLAGYFLSINLMVRAVRDMRKYWLLYLFSVLLGFYSVAAAEFYYGLEFVRLAVLWIVLQQTYPRFWPRLAQAFKYWTAYLLLFLGFTVWRVFFYVSANHAVTVFSQFTHSPVSFLTQSVRATYEAIFAAVVGAWTQALDLASYPDQGIMSWVILVLVVIVSAGITLWLVRLAKREPPSDQSVESNWGRQAFWVSSLSLVLAIIPFWAAGQTIGNQYPNDRFLLAYLFGSCLWIVAVLEILTRKTVRTALIIGLLVAAGVGFQFTQGLHYRNIWKQQDSLYWQIVWRMPSIQPGTTLMAGNFPNRGYYSDGAVTAQLNWTYANGIKSDRVIPYEFVLLDSTQREAYLNLSPNLPITSDFRTYRFVGNTSASLLISYNGESCLRVLDTQLTPPQGILDDYSKQVLDAADLSDLSLISQTPANHPPLAAIGAEPAHTWCYYFEKAELARQYKEYSQTLSLLNQAQEKGYSPTNLSEWFPFIDAYLHLGDFDQAKTVSQQINDSGNKIYEFGMCRVWSNFVAETSVPTKLQNLDALMKAISCK